MSADAQDPQLVFWPVGLGDRTFADHLEVAQAGGFDSIALTPNRAKQLLASGLKAGDIVDQAGERGLKIGPADGIATWLRDWRSTQGNPDLRAMMTQVFDIDVREALDISASLGMDAVVGVGFFDEGSIAEAELIEGFASFCDLAAPYGISIALEPIPFWGIPDLPLAWRIVDAAGRANASIAIDTWHIQKGSKDFVSDLELLASIPGHRLQHVQLADADLAPRAPALADDVMFRKFSGEGELQLAKILSIVMKNGGLLSVGPEIVSAEQSAMANVDIGIRSGETTRAVMASAKLI